jgi:DNA-binding CsgD family transcriptional regulator
VLRVLAATLTGFGRFDEAVAALEQALAEVPSGDRETSLQIEGDLSSIGRYAPSTYQRSVAGVARIAAEQGLRGETPAERLLLANLVGNRLHEEATAQEIRERAEWVLRAGLIAEQTSSCSGVYHAMMPLAIAGGYEVVAEACAEGLADARSRGSMLGLCAMLCIRSHLHWRLGDLEAAEHDAQGALANAEQQGLALPEASLAFLADPLVDAGKTAEIRALLQERGQWDSFPENGFMTNFLLPARARLRLALGDPAGALRDLRELERRTAAWPGADPRVHQLDALIAECLAAVGEREQALRYAEAALERARAWGTPRAIGLALRAHGLVSGGEEGLARLQDAVAALRQDRAPLELSRTLVDLGSAQRRAGKRIECREALREAIELAEACGAAPLAERAHQELVASGGRLRRQAPDSGPEALTPSERRVAEMAAAGATNREIAWQLVISVKTVEMHLGRVYRKLGVTNRHALAQLSLHR